MFGVTENWVFLEDGTKIAMDDIEPEHARCRVSFELGQAVGRARERKFRELMESEKARPVARLVSGEGT